MSDFVIVEVVGGGDFYAPGTEFGVNVCVADNR